MCEPVESAGLQWKWKLCVKTRTWASQLRDNLRADMIGGYDPLCSTSGSIEVAATVYSCTDPSYRDIPAHLLPVTSCIPRHPPLVNIYMSSVSWDSEDELMQVVHGTGYLVYWGDPNEAAYFAPVTYVPGTDGMVGKHHTSTTHSASTLRSAAGDHEVDGDGAKNADAVRTVGYTYDDAAEHEQDTNSVRGNDPRIERRDIAADSSIVYAREGVSTSPTNTAPGLAEEGDEDATPSFCCKASGCPLAFNRAANLLRHVRAAHTRVRSMCLVCGESLARQDAVVRHQSISTRCIQLQQEAIDAGAAEPKRRTADDVLASLHCVLRGDQRRAKLVASHLKGKKLQRRRK